MPTASEKPLPSSHAEELDVHDLTHLLAPGSTLIEASAGTGKTYTIAAIFLRLIVEEGLRGDQILVTTFTIPATAELRERIRRVLRVALEAFRTDRAKEPLTAALLEKYRDTRGEIATRLEEALHDFDQARISTIHGFCQRVLSECSFESGAAPNLELVTDEAELVHEVVCDFWRGKFYQCEECLAAAACVSNLSIGSLKDLLQLRLRQPLARVIPEADSSQLADLREEIPELLEKLRDCWSTDEGAIGKPFLELNTWSNLPFSSDEQTRELWEGARACLAQPKAPLLTFKSLLAFSNSALEKARKKRGGIVAPCHRFHDLCEELEQACQRYQRAVEADFLEWAPARLEEQKVRANLTSYHDLLSRLHAELSSARGTALIARLRGQYRAALIDEFQDTDALQEQIFQRIFAAPDETRRWLFLIGDPKQAIYGFRGADVFSYLAAATRAERRLTLKTNFRSTQPLVSATNAIFQSNERAFVVEGIGFEPAKAKGDQDQHAFKGDGPAAPLRIWTWEGEADTPIGEIRDELAQATASEIARLLSGSAKIGEAPVRPENIAVLTVSNDEATRMQQELRALRVPSVLLSNGSVFSSPEAADLLALLAAMALPSEERRVRTALLTGLLGLTLTELQALADDEPAWERKLQLFHSWHEAWLRGGFIAAFRRAVRDAGIRTRLVAHPDGERRLTNLVHLSELVQCAAMEEQLTPKATLEWLARRIDDAAKSPRAAEEEHELRLERDDEAVRIITIHKSKGLQYEIVFCPFSWKGLNGKDKKSATFHEPGGQLVLDLGSNEIADHLERELSEKLAEQVRLFYVAITRARVRCDVALAFTEKATDSAANWLLQQPPAEAGDDTGRLSEHFKTLAGGTWRRNLEALAERSGGAVALVDVPPAGAAPLKPTGAQKAPGKARRFRGEIERDFCVSSFSSLTEGASAEVPEQYVAPAGEEPATPGADDIHAFPAGARPGLCLHEIFERADFQSSANLEQLVSLKLGDYSLDPARWSGVVAHCVSRVLQTPLRDGFTLSNVAASARLAEREFHLPADRLEPAALREILSPGEEPGGLEFVPRRGWLKGFIDLVFRHGDRYYLADWKSNRLGASAAAYGPESLAAAMKSHHYGLQAHLYALALHRYLKLRQPSYDYEKHFGGMIYFFVRGADPAQPHLGTWEERPPLQTILKLEHWLKGEAP